MENTQEKKTYMIGDREFELKQSLTLREREAILPIMKKLRFQGLGVSLELSMKESTQFLFTVLKPVDQSKVESSFFEQVDEKLEVLIFSDFFFSRIELTSTLMNSLQIWKQNSRMLEENSKS